MKESIVLFAHGSREPEWAQPFERIASKLRNEFRVEVAYLEQMRPTLEEAIASLAAKGVQRVRIVPLFLGAGGHVREDLPKLAQAARERHAGVEIVLEPPIGERQEVTDAIAAVISKGNSHQSK
ncbi:MAG TPA: CbiX/SirB N-terminal domain-containing protein [Burkholderiales bacterium]|nr:CbiX/SirB N-terminal domain-containing protein [Burkholderiales bacterium]